MLVKLRLRLPVVRRPWLEPRILLRPTRHGWRRCRSPVLPFPTTRPIINLRHVVRRIRHCRVLERPMRSMRYVSGDLSMGVLDRELLQGIREWCVGVRSVAAVVMRWLAIVSFRGRAMTRGISRRPLCLYTLLSFDIVLHLASQRGEVLQILLSRLLRYCQLISIAVASDILWSI